ncbi:MAG TPA: 23S rRNA (uracil(1939)-C(5))-methyltransferase RlmD [Pseudacidobacterium sp.]|jgi:23S rRNA (uracil1939-C5)-methyltransferase|nr:23S rRNA (uracil(1939)-C(5))-methyltransferase RlmD [Pseudacidobacterium sp.]
MKLRIEKCIYGGAGLARAEGKAIFVPFTLPEELVEAHITEDKHSFANAELDAVLEPAATRSAPSCSYFGECGGCHYQHATYPQQVELKRSILGEALDRARLTDVPEIIPVFAEPLAYRNRVRLHIGRGSPLLCYKRRASHENLPVAHCPIAAPVLGQTIEVVNRIGDEFDLAEKFSEIELFTNHAQDEILLSLWAKDRAKDAAQSLKAFCETLKQNLPALKGAAVFSAEEERFQSRKIGAWEEQSLIYQAADRAYLISLGAFFQVNRFLIDKLVDLVCTGRSGKLAWDLYAGVGLFSAVLAKNFQQVIAVEAAPSSSQDLRVNLTNSKHKAITNSTLAFLRQQVQRKSVAPDLIVVDPPRSGLGKDVASLLTKVRAKTLIYVSCDPATLSRDLKALVESGYRLRNMHMVDLFPQTFHLESVTVLSLD